MPVDTSADQQLEHVRNEPDFYKLEPAVQREVLGRITPDFRSLPQSEQDIVIKRYQEAFTQSRASAAPAQPGAITQPVAAHAPTRIPEGMPPTPSPEAQDRMNLARFQLAPGGPSIEMKGATPEEIPGTPEFKDKLHEFLAIEPERFQWLKEELSAQPGQSIPMMGIAGAAGLAGGHATGKERGEAAVSEGEFARAATDTLSDWYSPTMVLLRATGEIGELGGSNLGRLQKFLEWQEAQAKIAKDGAAAAPFLAKANDLRIAITNLKKLQVAVSAANTLMGTAFTAENVQNGIQQVKSGKANTVDKKLIAFLPAVSTLLMTGVTAGLIPAQAKAAAAAAWEQRWKEPLPEGGIKHPSGKTYKPLPEPIIKPSFGEPPVTNKVKAGDAILVKGPRGDEFQAQVAKVTHAGIEVIMPDGRIVTHPPESVRVDPLEGMPRPKPKVEEQVEITPDNVLGKKAVPGGVPRETPPSAAPAQRVPSEPPPTGEVAPKELSPADISAVKGKIKSQLTKLSPEGRTAKLAQIRTEAQADLDKYTKEGNVEGAFQARVTLAAAQASEKEGGRKRPGAKEKPPASEKPQTPETSLKTPNAEAPGGQISTQAPEVPLGTPPLKTAPSEFPPVAAPPSAAPAPPPDERRLDKATRMEVEDFMKKFPPGYMTRGEALQAVLDARKEVEAKGKAAGAPKPKGVVSQEGPGPVAEEISGLEGQIMKDSRYPHGTILDLQHQATVAGLSDEQYRDALKDFIAKAEKGLPSSKPTAKPPSPAAQPEGGEVAPPRAAPARMPEGMPPTGAPATTAETESTLSPFGVDVQVKFPPSQEARVGLAKASQNPILKKQFKRLGITGFSIEEPYKFGLSEQGNIERGTGVIRLNAIADNPERTLAHELAHDIYERLDPQVQARMRDYIEANNIEAQHAGGMEERIADYFADVMTGNVKAPSGISDTFLSSPLKPRDKKSKPEREADTPDPIPVVRSWDEIRKRGGNITDTDDLAAIAKKYGEQAVVIQDVNGGRTMIPASAAAKVLATNASGYVREVFLPAWSVKTDRSGYVISVDRPAKGEIDPKTVQIDTNIPELKKAVEKAVAALPTASPGAAPARMPEGMPPEAGVSRTTPLPGTEDRKKLDTDDDAAEKTYDALNAKRRELETEKSNTKSYSKKAEALEKRIESVREKEIEAYKVYDALRKQTFQARLEDGANQPDNAPLRIASKYKIQERATEGTMKERPDYAAAKENLTHVIKPYAEDAAKRANDILDPLSQFDRLQAIDKGIASCADNFLSFPLTAGDDLVKRLSGYIRGEGMAILREKGIEKYEAIEKRGKDAGVLSTGQYDRFRSSINGAYSQKEIDDALAKANEFVGKMESDAVEEARSSEKASKEFSESLLPVSDIRTPNLRTKGVWSGNVVDGSPYLTDGHMAIRRDAVTDRKKLTSLESRGQQKVNIKPEAVEEVVKKAIDSATKPVRELGFGTRQGTDIAFYTPDGESIIPVDGKFVRFVQSVTGATRIMGNDKNSPLAFYLGDKAVAIVMPVKYDGPAVNPKYVRSHIPEGMPPAGAEPPLTDAQRLRERITKLENIISRESRRNHSTKVYEDELGRLREQLKAAGPPRPGQSTLYSGLGPLENIVPMAQKYVDDLKKTGTSLPLRIKIGVAMTKARYHSTFDIDRFLKYKKEFGGDMVAAFRRLASARSYGAFFRPYWEHYGGGNKLTEDELKRVGRIYMHYRKQDMISRGIPATDYPDATPADIEWAKNTHIKRFMDFYKDHIYPMVEADHREAGVEYMSGAEIYFPAVLRRKDDTGEVEYSPVLMPFGLPKTANARKAMGVIPEGWELELNPLVALDQNVNRNAELAGKRALVAQLHRERRTLLVTEAKFILSAIKEGEDKPLNKAILSANLDEKQAARVRALKGTPGLNVAAVAKAVLGGSTVQTWLGVPMKDSEELHDAQTVKRAFLNLEKALREIKKNEEISELISERLRMEAYQQFFDKHRKELAKVLLHPPEEVQHFVPAELGYEYNDLIFPKWRKTDGIITKAMQGDTRALEELEKSDGKSVLGALRNFAIGARLASPAPIIMHANRIIGLSLRLVQQNQTEPARKLLASIPMLNRVFAGLEIWNISKTPEGLEMAKMLAKIGAARPDFEKRSSDSFQKVIDDWSHASGITATALAGAIYGGIHGAALGGGLGGALGAGAGAIVGGLTPDIARLFLYILKIPKEGILGFGGLDLDARVYAALFLKRWHAAHGVSPPTMEEYGTFVTQYYGNYIRGTQTAAIRFLRDAGALVWAGFHIGAIPTELAGAYAGSLRLPRRRPPELPPPGGGGGIPNEPPPSAGAAPDELPPWRPGYEQTLWQRLQVIMLGIPSAILGGMAANWMLSKFFRGKGKWPHEYGPAQQDLLHIPVGKNSEVTSPFSTFMPEAMRPYRITGVEGMVEEAFQLQDDPDAYISSASRAWANTVLQESFQSPIWKPPFVAIFGQEPYIRSDHTGTSAWKMGSAGVEVGVSQPWANIKAALMNTFTIWQAVAPGPSGYGKFKDSMAQKVLNAFGGSGRLVDMQENDNATQGARYAAVAEEARGVAIRAFNLPEDERRDLYEKRVKHINPELRPFFSRSFADHLGKLFYGQYLNSGRKTGLPEDAKSKVFYVEMKRYVDNAEKIRLNHTLSLWDKKKAWLANDEAMTKSADIFFADMDRLDKRSKLIENKNAPPVGISNPFHDLMDRLSIGPPGGRL